MSIRKLYQTIAHPTTYTALLKAGGTYNCLLTEYKSRINNDQLRVSMIDKTTYYNDLYKQIYTYFDAIIKNRPINIHTKISQNDINCLINHNNGCMFCEEIYEFLKIHGFPNIQLINYTYSYDCFFRFNNK
jgi:hypothetical protein